MENKNPKLEESAIKEDLVLKKQFESDLKKHMADRSAVKETVARCGTQRESSASSFACGVLMQSCVALFSNRLSCHCAVRILCSQNGS